MGKAEQGRAKTKQRQSKDRAKTELDNSVA